MSSTSKEPIVWLHLSDIHYCPELMGWAMRPLEELIEDLRQVSKTHRISPDFLFLTGDLAFGEIPESQIAKQYEAFGAYLDKVREAFPCTIPKSHVFVVPGNHDVNRRKINRGNELEVTEWLKNDEARTLNQIDDLLRKGGENLGRFIRRLDEYRNFLDAYGLNHLLKSFPEQLTYGLTYLVRDISVGIAGLNTAWLAGEEHDEGRLFISRWQLETVSREVKDCRLRIALSHHPPRWLSPFERDHIEERIQRLFHFHLHGHEHRLAPNVNNSHASIASSAAFKSTNSDHGYNFTIVPTDGSTPMLLARRYSDKNGGGWVAEPKPGTVGDSWPLKGLELPIPNPPAFPPPRPQEPIEAVEDDDRQKQQLARIIPELAIDLHELIELFGAKRLAILFLDRRLKERVADVPDKQYNNYDKVKHFLSKWINRLRDLTVRDAIIYGYDQTPSKVAFDEFPEFYRQMAERLSGLRQEWSYWVGTSGSELLENMGRDPLKPFYPLKYILSEGNRDIFGFLVLDAGEDALHAARKKAGAIERVINRKLIPKLRDHQHISAVKDLYRVSERSEILDRALDAALTLSGADWGCIKTGTHTLLHRQPEGSNGGVNCEIVRAECVFHCPRFFHEGRLVKTESLVEEAIRKGESGIRAIGEDTQRAMHHPAKEMYIALIKDHDHFMEPLIDGSDVVGAIVLQHTKTQFLTKNQAIYEERLQEICEAIPQAIRRASADRLKGAIQLIHKVQEPGEMGARIEMLLEEIFIEGYSWMLVTPNGSKLETVAKSDNLPDDIGSLIGLDRPDGQQDLTDSLIGLSFGGSVTFCTGPINSKIADLSIRRVGHNLSERRAFFEDNWRMECDRLKEEKQNQLILNLGKQQVVYKAEMAQPGNGRDNIYLTLGSIRFTTGLPLGVLVVVCYQGVRNEQLDAFNQGLKDLQGLLYARIHGANTTRNQAR